MSSFNTLIIHFETSAQLPPPYSYRYVLSLTPLADGINAHLQLTYTDRDELDADEIEAEGFTDNDDYEWKGDLKKTWSDEVEKTFLKTKLTENALQDEESNFLTIEVQSDTLLRGRPKNITDWQYLAQELLQAIYETSEKERPFEIYVLDITSHGTREAVLTGSFRNRSAQVKRVLDGKSSLRFYPWQDLPSLMETLYAVDWLTDAASEHKPKKNGLYLNPGDGLWYEWGKQLVEIGKNGKALSIVKTLIVSLLN